MSKGNLLANIPADLSEEAFEVLVNSDNVRIERIISKGHTSPETGWYDQEQDEWVMVVKGHAEIEFEEGPPVLLAAGDYVEIPAHRRHRVTFTSANPETIWLAIHY
jgi:cupin 2 domain-containing protein